MHPVVKALSSLRITVTCLTLLLLLTFWGTLYQTELWGNLFNSEYGLYAAQQRFFNSWFLSAADLIPIQDGMNPILVLLMKIPLPATRLVMWVFFINLMFFMLFKMNWTWKRIGIVITHFGILLFFVSSFSTFHFAEESALRIIEGQTSNVTAAYHKWELAVMKVKSRTETEQVREILAIDSNGLTAGEELVFDGIGLEVYVEEYHDNCNPVALPAEERADAATPFSGLDPLKRESEPERNFPGGIFVFRTGKEPVELVLHSLMRGTVPLEIGGEEYAVALQRKQYQLPFSIHLKDVMQEVHEGTSVARNYQSKVDMIMGGVPRAIDIKMNEPLREGNLTFFQANYERLEDGSEASRFAVVRNSGRILPYIASGVTVGGLIVHFLMMLATHMKRAARKAAA